MSSYITKYRADHPEFAVKDREKTINYIKNKYATDPEYREKVKQRARDLYKKKQELKNI